MHLDVATVIFHWFIENSDIATVIITLSIFRAFAIKALSIWLLHPYLLIYNILPHLLSPLITPTIFAFVLANPIVCIIQRSFQRLKNSVQRVSSLSNIFLD